MARTRKIKPETLFFSRELMGRLNFIKGYPLTLIEAPSGFGKTTALRHFLDSEVSGDARILWLTFTEKRPEAGWKAFCALIGQFDPDSAARLTAAGLPDEDTLPEAERILQDLCCREETYLVLDDLFLWQLPELGRFLNALSGHGGRALHVVAVSQPLPREIQKTLTESSRLFVLREAAFAFSRQDISAYYRQAGVSLNALQLEQVWQITEGWVMALYLQLLSFIEKGRFEGGDIQNIIRNTLWNRLPDDEKEFLVLVCVFPRFTLDQAAALSGVSVSRAGSILREEPVFVHFDPEARRFHFHALFQQFLSGEFELLPGERRRAVYLTGGDLSMQAGDRTNALRFYYHSGNWERFFSMPLTSYELADVVDESTRPMILDMIENTPFEVKRKYPAAMLSLAFTLFFLHENQRLLSFQAEIRQAIAQSDLPGREKNALSGEMELLLSFLEYNRIDAMSRRHRKALKLLGGAAAMVSVKSTWTFGAPSVLYMFYRESGGLDEELDQMDRCMPVYYELTRGHGSGAEFIMRGEAHLMRGERGEAEILCHKAIFAAESRRQSSIVQCGLFLLARIALQAGDKAGLENALSALAERSRQNTEDLCRYTLDLARGFLYLPLGRGEEIAPWLSAGEIGERRLVIMTQPFAHIIYSRLLLERGEYQKLLGVSEFGLGLSAVFPNLLPQIYLHLCRAQAFDALGKGAQAVASLNRALEIALPDGLLLPFAEHYEGLRRLLLSSDCGGEARERIGLMAGEFSRGLAAITGEKELTPREREIVLLLKRDLTNPQIAQQLHLSPNTVRNVISGLLKKRGLSSRTQLKLLPDLK